MDCNMAGLPVPYHLLEFAQVHVHSISDAIQPSHSLMPLSPSAVNLSQHHGLFQWVICLHRMTKILEFQLQHVLPLNIHCWSPLKLTCLISLLSKGRLGVYYSTTVWRQQFEHFGFLNIYLFMYLFIWLGQVLVATCRIEGSLPSLQSGSRNLMWPLERP